MTDIRTETAQFAAGCFWGIEKAFLDTPGVVDAESGYAGGRVDNPTYEQVCTDRTGHAETVRVTFDPDKTSYEALVRRFFAIHDPTQLDRQGPDVGSQYRSVIFYESDAQKAVAERVKAELAPHYAPKAIVTDITAAGPFWRAEEYHQRYFEKHPDAVCHI